jgi:hypothetical protein
MDIPPVFNSFRRLLAYRVGQRFGLQHMQSDYANEVIILFLVVCYFITIYSIEWRTRHHSSANFLHLRASRAADRSEHPCEG